MTDSIPIIDIAPFRGGDDAAKRRIAAAVDRACVETGFFAIVGHGVTESLVLDMRRSAVDFFALPEPDKLAVERPPSRISRGYNRIGDRALAYSRGVETPPDSQESFAIGPLDVPDEPYFTCERARAHFAPNLWPDRPADLRPVMSRYFVEMETLAATVLRMFALALGQNELFFDDKIDRHTSSLRLLRYPGSAGPTTPGQRRAGEHTDYGVLTIVRGDNLPGGLQIKHRHGGWMDVERPEGGFICNIGDMMARWTNDHWVSNLHRVGLPPEGAPAEDRISLVFFHNANYDAEIRCITDDAEPKYPARPFDEIYLEKLMRGAHKTLEPEGVPGGG